MARAARRLGAIVCALILGIGSLLIFLEHINERQQQHNAAELVAHHVATSIFRKWTQSEQVAHLLAHRPLPTITAQSAFEREAASLAGLLGDGAVLQWAPAAVVSFAHPLAGNEPAITYDLLAAPGQRAAVEKMIATGEARWSGPLPLKQGGSGMVYRVPLFAAGPTGEPPFGAKRFIGLATVLLKLPEALSEAVENHHEHHLRIWLGSPDNAPTLVWDGGSPVEAASPPASAMADEAMAHLSPAGTPFAITVTARPPAGEAWLGLPARLSFLVVIAALLGWLSSSLTRQQMERRGQQQKAQEYQQMRQIFERSLSASLLFDTTGEVVLMNPQAETVFHLTPEQTRSIVLWENAHWLRLGWTALARATLDDGDERAIDYRGPGSRGQPLDVHMRFRRISLSAQPHLLIDAIDLTAIHAAEAARQESEANYRQLFEASPVPYLILAPEQLAVLDCNQAATTLLGGSRETLIGADPFHFSPPRQPDGRPRQLADAVYRNALKEGSPASFEWTYCRCDGTTFQAEVRLASIRFQCRDALLASWIDISERQKAYLLAQHFQNLVASSGDAIVSKSLDGTILSWNRSAELILGFSQEEIIGQSIYRIIPDGLAVEEDFILERIKTGQRVEKFETVRRTRDGHCIDASVTVSPIFDSTGKIVGASKILRDISETKRLQRALTTTNNNLEKLVDERTRELRYARQFADSLLDTMGGVFVLLDADGRIQRFNQAAQRVTGFSLAELANQPVWDHLIPPEAQTAVRGVFDNLMHDRIVGYFENEWLTKSGERRLFAWHNTVMRDATGQVTHIMATGIDITRARQQERELERHRQHLEELVAEQTSAIQATSQRLEQAKEAAEAASLAKSQLLANVSHELRTPLNVSLGLLQILNRGPLDPQQQDFVRRALGASRNLLGQIDDMIDYVRIDAGTLPLDPAPFALPPLLAELVEDQRMTAQDKGLNLWLRLDETLPAQVVGDARRLSQIVVNLLGNAIKFTTSGEVGIVAGWQAGSTDSPGDWLTLQVSDTGSGMSAEQLSHIFERFYQGDDNATSGLGLGLAIAHGLIQRMGGQIEVHSAPGVGSRFDLRLPMLALTSPAALVMPAVAADAQPLNGLRILCAEDNPENQFVIRTLLEDLGATAHIASDGAKAVQYAQEAQPPYDAVLMDMRMPRLDGLAATRAIRQIAALASLPIVALTANASSEDRQASAAAGMNGFLAKPVDRHKLATTLLEVCGRIAPRSAGQAADAAPPPPHPDDPEGIELSAALERIGGSLPIYTAMARHFIALHDETRDKLQQAANSGEYHGLAAHLHSLRGSALSLGVTPLAQACKAAENRYLQDDPADTDGLLEDVMTRLDQACQQLTAVLADIAAEQRPTPD